MEGTHIFLLLVWCLLANVPLGVTGDGPETIENSTAVLECGIQEQHTYRYWYTGQFNKTTPPPGGDKGKLFEQFQNNQPVSKTKRSDMSADSGSFALTIGSVMLDDDGYFTCSSKYGNDDTIYKSQRIHVYIPAEIQFDGPDDGTSFNATDTAEVTCTINRLYPPLTDLSQFKIKWDDNVVNTSKDISSDDDKNSAKMYEVSLNRTLCPGDNKKHLVCEVKPDRGPAYMVDRTYTVQYGPLSSPSVTVEQPKETIPEDTAKLTCHVENIKANPPISSDIRWHADGAVVNVWSNKVQRTPPLNCSINYTCSAGNIIGYSMSEPKEVYVYQEYAPRNAPKLLISERHPNRSHPVTFDCTTADINASPAVDSITWYKDNELLNTWPTNTFNHTINVTENDSGNYNCSVGNGKGFSKPSAIVYLNVSDLFAPIGTPIIEFHENPTNGDKVTFTCNTKGVKGNPKMSFVKWYGDDELDWVSKECCTYTLRVNLNSSGDYSCLVGNTYGSTPKSDGKFLNVSATVVAPTGNPGPAGSPLPIGAVVGGVFGGLFAVVLVGGIVFFIIRRKNVAKGGSNNGGGSTMELAQNTYANVDTSGNPRSNGGVVDDGDAGLRPIPSTRKPQIKPKPMYQADGATANPPTTYSSSGDLYAQIDKSKKESELTYAELDLPNKRQAPKPAPRQEKKVVIDEPPTDYAEVDWEKTRAQRM